MCMVPRALLSLLMPIILQQTGADIKHADFTLAHDGTASSSRVQRSRSSNSKQAFCICCTCSVLILVQMTLLVLLLSPLDANLLVTARRCLVFRAGTRHPQPTRKVVPDIRYLLSLRRRPGFQDSGLDHPSIFV